VHGSLTQDSIAAVMSYPRADVEFASGAAQFSSASVADSLIAVTARPAACNPGPRLMLHRNIPS
jgi:hypothetical protein